jgi:hypothetical protein
MRAIIVALALTSATPVAAAELSATMQRAAYCSGVLKFNIENYTPSDTPDNVCLGWREQHFASRDACKADAVQTVLASMQAQLKRYNDYLRLEIAQRILLRSQDGTDEMMSVALIRAKGRRDAHAMRTTPLSSHKTQCIQRCWTDSGFQCLVDCIAQQHPTDASVMRCVLLPDELPY